MSRGRVRSIAAAVLMVLATVLFAPSVVAFWGNRTVNDTEQYLETVGPLASTPEMQQALSQQISGAILARTDAETFLRNALADVIKQYPATEKLIGPLAAAFDAAIREVVNRLVTSQAFQDIWIEVNRIAQLGFIAALKGDPNGPVQLQGDQVVLDLTVVIDEVKKELVNRGFAFAANIQIDVKNSQIVLVTAPQLAQLRTIYSFTNPVASYAFFVVCLIFVVAVLLSQRRARSVGIVGAIVLGSMALLSIALAIANTAFVNAFTGTPWAAASEKFWDQLLVYLTSAIVALVAIGAILVLAGWFASSAGAAARARLSAAASQAPIPVSEGLRAVASRWLVPLRIVAIGIPVLVLILTGSLTLTKVLVTLMVVLLLLAAIELVRADRSSHAHVDA